MIRIAGLAAGTIIIYGCGAAWLLLSAGISLPAALLVGVLLFLPGDILKGAGVFLLGERLR